VIGVAGGFQIATRSEMAPWIRKLYKERLTVRLSSSALETLAIIAYKQPITRSEIEQIRGVEASGVMETLLERRLVKVVGRKETIGRPLLYGTTTEFLRQFGLKHLSELPDLQSYQLPPQNTDAVQELPFAEGEQEAVAVESAVSEGAAAEETPTEVNQ
jgi:segregation and condensation protein B